MSPKKASQLCEYRDETGLTFLSCALGFDAPTDVICDILKVDPSLAKEKDMFEASILHIACSNGARFDNIDVIVTQFPDLVSELDGDMRCPLHHAVEYACLFGDEGHSYLDVIELLFFKDPEMIYSEDKNGDTPIDIVQNLKQKVNINSSLYPGLQNISAVERGIDLLKEKKKKEEIEGCREIDLWNRN